jgi:flagellar assembly factor FliW
VSPTVADRECRSALQRSAPTVVYFDRGLPGYDGLRRWELVERDETRPLRWLRSVEQPQLALPVADPALLLAGYPPAIPSGVWSRLGEGSEGRSLCLVVVQLEAEGASANLRAPLVIDPQTMRGEQVILDDGDWPVRFEFARPEQAAAHSGTGRSPACSSSAAR